MKAKFSILAATAALMAIAGSAQAATDINIYGASAQFTFWTAVAKPYLVSQGCTEANITQAVSADKKHGIASAPVGTGNCASGINLRYSSKASYDGIRAVKGSCVGDSSTCVANPDGCPDDFSRKMITSATNLATSCQTVHIGASDVAGESFTQESHGALKGPNGGAQTDRIFSGITVPANVTATQSIVVPFGFFANKSIQYQGATIDSITRMQAVNIFSGSSWYWSDFGSDYSTTAGDGEIVACLRHAGSGTHATMDLAVMNAKWGAPLVQSEAVGGPNVYFNDGSSDEMKCINQLAGAIGYADADQLAKQADADTYPNVTGPLKYNGFAPTRVNVVNGLNDFWATQWLYINTTNYGATSPVKVQYNNLIAYAADKNNLSAATIGAEKAAYWAAKSEMVYMKPSDKGYPVYVGAAQ